MGFCEPYNEPPGSIKGREFLDQISDYQFFKDSAPWISQLASSYWYFFESW